MLIRLLKASWAGLEAAAAGGLKAPVLVFPEVLVDNGVFRPEANGEGVGWREGKEENALEEFMMGFFWDVLDVADADQSMLARSSISSSEVVVGFRVSCLFDSLGTCQGIQEQCWNERVCRRLLELGCWPLVACCRGGRSER